MIPSKFKHAHMQVAEVYAQLSSATRLKVGSVIIKDNRIISIGYNGMPSGWTNECEHEGKTKPEVLHAESNAIAKLAASPESGEGASIFITHAPCIDCAKLIYQSGIKEVYYKNDYRSTQGVDFLKKCDIMVSKLKLGDGNG
jgi:dCMP deaminase